MNNTNTQADKKRKRKPWSRRKKITAVVASLIIGAAIYFLIPILFVVFNSQPVRVEGVAMAPTLNDGDRIFISKQTGNLERGDIVVFYYPKDQTKSFIKRIIGLPGEMIDIDSNGGITINGSALDEGYVPAERSRNMRVKWEMVREEWKQIEEGSYFVMGDNRDASNDSRSYGPVRKELIYGKVVDRYWPIGSPIK
jgi:signal peptidase I